MIKVLGATQFNKRNAARWLRDYNAVLYRAQLKLAADDIQKGKFLEKLKRLKPAELVVDARLTELWSQRSPFRQTYIPLGHMKLMKYFVRPEPTEFVGPRRREVSSSSGGSGALVAPVAAAAEDPTRAPVVVARAV